MITRCYYEQKREELLSSFLHSFTAYIRRHKKMPDLKKEEMLNFIKFTSKLSKNWYNKKHTKTQLLEQVKETPNLRYRDWLKQKIKELK